MVSHTGSRTVAGRSVNGLVALAFGAVFVVVGLAGFLVSGGHPAVGTSGGALLGLFQYNVLHNVVYVSGPKFRSSRPRMRNGSTFSVKLTQPGTIHYLCSIHPWMKGTVVVSP